MYAPRELVAAHHEGIITSDELRDVLLAHTQTELSTWLGRWVDVVEIQPLSAAFERLLFPQPGPAV
jgi:hypothetical protein